MLSVNGILLVYALLTALVFRLLFGQFFRGITVMDSDFFLNGIHLDLSETARIQEFFEGILQLMKVVFFYIMPPLFWVLSFLRLRDSEVK